MYSDDGRWTMDDGRWTMDDGRLCRLAADYVAASTSCVACPAVIWLLADMGAL